MENLFIEVEGKVVGLSHTFRLCVHPLFIIELLSGHKTHFILVRQRNHFSWHSNIHPGSSYHVSNLKQDIIYKGTYNIKILTTSRHSKLSLVKEECQNLQNTIQEDPSEFVCFKSIVTSIINEEVGIYKLGGNVVVVLSYLKDLAAELANDDFKVEEENKSPEDTLKNNASAPFKPTSHCIRVGDELSVFNAHALKERDGTITLVCCGKSLIRNERSNVAVYGSAASDNGVLHCLHTFNLGMKFLNCLLDLQEFLIKNLLAPDDPHDMVTKRKWKGGKGILCEFVEEYLKNYESKARSLLLEFLLKNHFCVVSKEFEGISPLKINDLSNCLQVRDENEDEEHLWKYFSLGRKEHSWVTFGVLKLTDGGNLKIENKDQSIDILIVGSRSYLYHKVGKLVAVSNFDYVEEEFRIYGVGNITRRYITLHSKHVISLVIGMSDPLQISATTNYNLITFKLRVTSVSGLKFFKNDLKRERLNGFFVTKAYVSKEEADIAGGKKEECWSTLIRFKGSLANVHPFLSEPCVIRGKVRSENIDLHFRKQQNFSWLIPMSSQFGTCECVEAPFDFEVQSIESISLPIPSDSIATILEGSNLGSNMFNIEGTIIQKKFMTPKYESQIAEIPLKALNGGIGVPGSKLIRLLVYDTKYPEYKIWIYLSNDNQFCVSQYHLGLIPGAEIYITWLQRFVSKSNLIYLSETQFTRITVQSFNISKRQSLPTNHKFISELYSLPSGSVCLMFATLSYIMNVSLKSICSCCESDFENGACSFVGCHANEQSIIVGSAKIIVDDGSETASVFVKDLEHIKALFSITESQWNSLNKVVSEQPLNFRRNISEQPADFEVDDAQKGFASFVTNPQNFRPLKVIGRIFPMRESPLSPTLLSLFALKLVPINPTAHISSLKKSN